MRRLRAPGRRRAGRRRSPGSCGREAAATVLPRSWLFLRQASQVIVEVAGWRRSGRRRAREAAATVAAGLDIPSPSLPGRRPGRRPGDEPGGGLRAEAEPGRLRPPLLRGWLFLHQASQVVAPGEGIFDQGEPSVPAQIRACIAWAYGVSGASPWISLVGTDCRYQIFKGICLSSLNDISGRARNPSGGEKRSTRPAQHEALRPSARLLRRPAGTTASTRCLLDLCVPGGHAGSGSKLPDLREAPRDRGLRSCQPPQAR